MGARALIVDDSRSMRQMVGGALEAAGQVVQRVLGPPKTGPKTEPKTE